ncbi:MAG TPA: hypothetical protein VK469_01185 [Candidatus Kapabacteria bacterium]|nr:hypothetical protein [Candidatus Kapabacteria bacterium]
MTEAKREKKTESSGKTKFWTNFLGIYILIMALLMVFFVYKLWPVVQAAIQDKKITADTEIQIILLVLITGALGSFVHSATSFVTYAGNRSLVTSWVWWYMLRPIVGMSLALIFYFVIRGGFISMNSTAESLNLFGIVAVSGLVGMFSKQATDKLQEIFDTLFKTAKGNGDDIRKDKLDDKILACERMIPVRDIISHKILKGQTEKDVKIGELYNKFKGVVTRLPIFDSDDKVKYLIHQSELSKYIADKCCATLESKPKSEILLLTLEEFLSDPGTKELVSGSIAFVSKNATLREAKTKMEETTNCRDIFITEKGKSDEPVLGWLTDIDINKDTPVE